MSGEWMGVISDSLICLWGGERSCRYVCVGWKVGMAADLLV